MTIPVNIRMETEVRDRLNKLWLRLKTVDPAMTQGETLGMALSSLERELDGKAEKKS